MNIRPLISKDREKLKEILLGTQIFFPDEIEVATELIDTVLTNPNQKDYKIYCMVNNEDQPLGYICFGPIPMTKGSFDLYWIVVDPQYYGNKIGSKLLSFLEEEIQTLNGRMILIDTSSLPTYERARRFYQNKGYKEIARIPDFYWPGNDRITYCKKII
ncbi:MAG: GNAT family N-acetyltransferase [Thermodesulfobacteriota bacterium]